MATVTASKSFTSGETVYPADLNLLGTPTVAVTDGEITTSKLFSPCVTPDKLTTGAVTGAAGGGKLAASAITGQTQKTTVADADEFLIHSSADGALRRMSYSVIKPVSIGVLQVKASKTTIATDLASLTIADSGIPALSITRTTQTSSILIELTGGRALPDTNPLYTYFYVRNNNGSYIDAVGAPAQYMDQNSANDTPPHAARCFYTPPAGTTTIDVKVYYKGSAGQTYTTNKWHYGTGAAGTVPPFVFTLTEISA